MKDRQDLDISNGILNKYMGPGGDVVIPAGVTKIGNSAFDGCTGLQSVTIPKGVTEIGDCAFADCTSLTSVTIPEGVTKFGWSTFSGCTGLQSVTILEGVTTIGNYAFDGCTGLQSVTILEGVTAIGNYAFAECTGLTSVVLPKGVTEIDESVFMDCRPALIAPHIPIANFDKKDKPGACAGFAVRYLEHAELDEETTAGYLKYIKGQKKRLFPTAVKYEELLRLMLAEKFLTSKDIGPLLKECDKQNHTAAKAAVLAYVDKNLKPVDPVKEAERSAKIQEELQATGVMAVGEAKKIFLYKRLKEGGLAITGYEGTDTDVVIPKAIGKDPVKKIDEDAFRHCTNLTSVTILEGVTEIGWNAFSFCTGLQRVTIPESVTKIGEWAFLFCTGLQSVTIPKSVREFGGGVFEACLGLQSVSIPEGIKTLSKGGFENTPWLKNLGEFAVINHILLAYQGHGGDVTIPAGVAAIGEYAFRYCLSLTSVIIPESVTEIRFMAFYGCPGLQSVTIPEGVTEIGEDAFFCCTGLQSVTIPKSVAEIGKSAFFGCTSLQSVTIPEGVTEIGKDAFEGCNSLTILVSAGSYAEQYARENGIKFEAL